MRLVDLSDLPVSGFATGAGLEVTALEPDRVSGQVAVAPGLLDARGLLHHGVLSAAVETLASIGAAAWFEGRGHVVGVANSTSAFSDITSGILTAIAQPVDRGEERQQWSVEVRDDDARLVAAGTVLLANVPDAAVLA